MGSRVEQTADVWRHRTPDWARRSARRWLILAATVFVARIVAYFTLRPEGWRLVDVLLPSAAVWLCIVVAGWRRGFLAGWERGQP